MTVILEYDFKDQPQAYVVNIGQGDQCTCGSAIGYPAHGQHFKSTLHMDQFELAQIGLTLSDVGR